jgi:hypothetical protein
MEKSRGLFSGPFTTGEYFGTRMKQEEAGIVVCSYLKNMHPHMKLQPEDVKLYSYKKANALLFQLQMTSIFQIDLT